MTALEPRAFTVELPVVIRQAVRADLPRMEWYGQYAHYRNLYRRSFREQREGKRILLVADCQDFPIGQIFIQLISTNRRIADGIDRAYLYSFRVMPMLQGRGIGTRLVQEAESILVARGFSTVTIAVAKDNARALSLYERLDYHKFGEDPGRWQYVDHRGNTRSVHEPCWVLEKSLKLR